VTVQFAEHDHGVIGGLRIDFALIEKVASDEDEIDVSLNSVTIEHFMPGPKEVQSTVGQIIPSYPQMYVCDVKESRHLFTHEFFGSPLTDCEFPRLKLRRGRAFETVVDAARCQQFLKPDYTGRRAPGKPVSAKLPMSAE